MSYGPPNQPPPNIGPPSFGPAPKPSLQSRLLAPTAAPNKKTLMVGLGAVVVGVLLIVFSFLTWLSLSATISEPIPGAGEMKVNVEMSVTGVGVDSSDVDISMPDGVPDGLIDESQIDPDQSGGDGPGSPAIWTIVFGVLLIVGGALIAVRRFPGIGAIIVAVAGLATTIATIVFVADPLGAFGGDMGDVDSSDASAGYGLWLTLVLSLIALAVGAAAVLGTLFPEKLGGPKSPVGPGFGPQPGFGPAQPPNFGQQPPNYGQQPPNFGKQPPNFGPPRG